MANKVIAHINIGIINGEPSWVFEYTTGMRESFTMDTITARQFYQGLQEVTLICENQERSLAKEQIKIGDSVRMRLIGGEDE